MASPASIPSRALDPSGEPGATSHSSAKPSGEAIAITVQDDFLLELGAALGGQIAVRPVDSVATALEHLSGSRRVQILLIDSRDAADLRGDVERVHAQAPHLPLIVFASSDSEKSVAGSLKSSNVFAVLPIPVDPRKTAAILEGALTDAAAKRSAVRNAERGVEVRAGSRAPLVPEPQPAPAVAREVSEDDPPSRKGLLVAVIAAVLVLGAGTALYFRGKAHSPVVAGAVKAHNAAAGDSGARVARVTVTEIGAPEDASVSGAGAPGSSAAGSNVAVTGVAAGTAGAAPATAGPQSAAATYEAAKVPLAEGTLDELLEKARLAMRERRYTEPASNCALLYYRSALKVDPTNGEARDGMGRLASVVMSRFDDAMSAGRYDEAGSAVADLKIASPGDIRLGTLEGRLLQAQVNSAFADGDVDRATTLIRQAQQSGAVPASQLAKWRATLARNQNEARAAHLASLLNARIRDGRLIEPSGDSAKYYLQQLKQLTPDNPAVERSARDLIAACLAKARDAAVAGQSAAADRWVGEARQAGMTATDFSTYQRDVAAGRAQAAAAEADRLAQLVRDRMQNGALTSPANDSAVYYLTQLQRASGDSSAVHSIGLELASRLLEQATASARAGKIEEMNADLALAKRWGADPALVQAVEQIVSGPPKTAQPGEAASPGIPPGYVPRRIHYVAPEFPEAALNSHVSGSVTVEFTVDRSGRPYNVHVVQSTRRGIFNDAAVEAVSQWRFEPPPAEIPTRTVIRFVSPND